MGGGCPKPTVVRRSRGKKGKRKTETGILGLREERFGGERERGIWGVEIGGGEGSETGPVRKSVSASPRTGIKTGATTTQHS